jgi:hypothetical protein
VIVSLFEMMTYVIAFSVVALLIWLSLRQGRVTPLLAGSIAMVSTFWMEGPFDWAMWCQFNPEFERFPITWGPFGLTDGGLVALVPAGYAFFLAIPVTVCSVLARRIAAASGFNPIAVLLAVGLAFGVLWDLPNQLLGVYAGWWRYARGPAGITLNAGTQHTYSLGELFFLSTFIMMCTYFIARRDEQDRTLMEAWAARHFFSSLNRSIANIAATCVIVNALFVFLFVPFLITRIFNLFTETYTGPLFARLRPPSGDLPDPSLGWSGTLVILGYVSIALVVFVGAVMRWDPQARREAAPALVASH